MADQPHESWHDHPVIWLALLVAVLVAVATAAAVLGRVDGSLGDATTTMSHVPLPDDPLTPGDLDGLRFDTVTRGYRMSQVDAVVDRLRREISDLEGRLGEPATSTGLGARGAGLGCFFFPCFFFPWGAGLGFGAGGRGPAA